MNNNPIFSTVRFAVDIIRGAEIAGVLSHALSMHARIDKRHDRSP